MSIRIITDSASDIEQNKYEGLTIIPLGISFGDMQYQDGINLSHKEFYELLIEQEELPKTSQVAPFAFEEAYEKVKAAGDEAIVITLSSKLSGTNQSANIALDGYEDCIHIVDSLNVCVGQQILVLLALRLVEQGLGVQEIIAKLEEEKKNIRVLALFDTLEYLRKGGRVSNLAGVMGNALAIKPVIAVVDGEIAVLGKARGSKNGNNMLTKQIQEAGGIRFDMPLSLGYSGLSDALLQKYVADHEFLWVGKTEELPVTLVGGAIGTHAGPGAIAIGYFA